MSPYRTLAQVPQEPPSPKRTWRQKITNARRRMFVKFCYFPVWAWAVRTLRVHRRIMALAKLEVHEVFKQRVILREIARLQSNTLVQPDP
jgi:hypothetical protein